MENLALLLHGFSVIALPQNLLAALIGAFLGLLIGPLPGIGSVSGVALLLPMTFRMEPTAAIIMLAGIYYGSMYGGAFSAILLNIPGDSPAIMTALDGYPMAQQGKAGKALFASNFVSFLGGTMGIIMLTIMGPLLASIGLRFGPVEMVSLLILALSSIGWMLGEDPKRGLISTFLGMLLSTVGMDPVTGRGRFLFGSINLLAGIGFVPLVIGMFGFSQVIELVMKRQDFSSLGGMKITLRESLLNKEDLKAITPVALRGGAIGILIGILPGAGATISSFISYIFNKRMCKNGDSFRKGAIEGVAASESANSAAAVDSFAPMLSFGIPGSGTTAVLLGGLMMWGLRPGPLLFTQEPDFVWGLIASMYIGNLICLALAMAIIPFLIHIVRVPHGVMIPSIMALCIVGSYSINNSMFDVYVMLTAGIFAYVFQAFKYPLAPFLLAFVLTPRLETSLTQAFQISQGRVSIFFTSPISLALLSCLVQCNN